MDNNDNDLDFLGIKFINPGEYASLDKDQRTCVSLAQIETLAVAVRVYQIDKDKFTGSIKGNIAAVGRETIVQEVDSLFCPDGKSTHLILHKKEDLSGDAKPGDEVVISYADGSGHIIPVGDEAKFAYDIDFEGDPMVLDKITQFLNSASDGGKFKLTSDRIAEVVGNAVTNAGLAAFREFGMKAPESVEVAITEHIRILDLKSEAILVSEKMLKAHQFGYRLDMQESTRPQEVFRGAIREHAHQKTSMKM